MSTAASTVLQALRAGDVIPNVVPESATAGVKSALRVHYPEYTISEGEAIPRAATLKQPDLEFQNAESNATYTIIMADPDLTHKNDKIAGQVRHWLQSGVRFDETSKRTAAATSATALNDYVPPSPAYGTGKHRYVFIAAKEPAGYAGPQGKDFPTNGPADLKDRMRFDAARYCSEENLTIEAVGFMQVDADAAATKDNIALTGEAIKNAIIGK
ncbi:hypothetical protein JCM8115_003121 [Rhodotorula mucilaginosa]